MASYSIMSASREWQQRLNSQITYVPFGGDYRDDPHHSTSHVHHSTVSRSQHQITDSQLIRLLDIRWNTYEL